MEKIKDLQEKIYSMSCSYLPLDVFFNDIDIINVDNYNKEEAYKDIEKIANFILDLQQQLEEKDKEIANLQVLIIENKNDIKEMREFKIGDNEYDLTDEDARNDIKCQIENQTQLAIQELEKVNTILYESHYKQIGNKYYATLEDIENVIDQQIKELKNKN